MCTLTLMPQTDGGLIITSNRDEAPNRETLLPELYQINGSDLLYPKDMLAGGTWIGVSDRKRFVCLMNGGFKAHERKSEYRMSRGIIVTNLLSAEDFLKAVDSYDFQDIEPFTIVAVDWSVKLRIYELIWDGANYHLTEKPLAPAIWSSSLLYSEEMKRKREAWFSDFLFDNLSPSENELLDFHKNAGEGNPETNLIMDRIFVKTKSITQVMVKDSIEMYYEDLQNKKTIRIDF
ncbi:MAG: NRDE family protein [Bacteroidia bacterium]|nr:NRDE family protein [Bacteroidia bacterium]NNF29921.1 hypothetical protein [Flavobacteriaceae bacterium]MBT8275832.1 NRDE family protein [Bacteroidia bacterium]NNJ81144.1 hypothetical protein [Flavobacteriaceae bacterium]NNK53387.1 hypothetical protein [Flavobacteriaceae bacterium]